MKQQTQSSFRKKYQEIIQKDFVAISACFFPRKIFLSLAICLSPFVICSAQGEGAFSDFFLSMPDSLIPLLNEKGRKDLVDFHRNGMEAKVHNALGEYSTLLTLTDDYLQLQLSAKSRMEMKCLTLLPDSSTVVAVVTTVFGPAADSQVHFYDADWKRIASLSLPLPEVTDFWSDVPDSLSSVASQAQAMQRDLPLVEVRLSPEAPSFELHLQTSELPKEEKDAANKLVHPLRYLWTGNSFVPNP